MIARITLVLALCVGVFAGCLGEPPIEERWTFLEMMSFDVPDSAALAPGDRVTVAVDARVTFRQLMTGFLVGEVRVSSSLTPDSLALDDEDLILVSENVDRLIANSTPVSRDVKGLAGFPQLRRRVPFEFDVTVPANSGPVFTPGAGPVTGLFLVLYMGEGEEIELEDGRDSLVVTPFTTHENEILATAYAIDFSAPVVPSP